MGFGSRASVKKTVALARAVAPPAAQIFQPTGASLVTQGGTPTIGGIAVYPTGAQLVTQGGTPVYGAGYAAPAGAQLVSQGGTPTIKVTWDPTLLGSALVGWYDASQITGKNDGDALAQWDDLSGLAHHLLQASANFKPLYKTAIQNGLAVARFDGIDDVMKASFTLNQPHTQFVAFVQHNASPGKTVLEGAGGDNWARLGSNIIAGNLNGQAYAGATGINSGVSLTNGGAFTMGCVYNNASSVIRVGATEVTGTVGTNNAGGVRVANTLDVFAQIDACEIIQTNTALSLDDRTFIANYFHAKWNTA